MVPNRRSHANVAGRNLVLDLQAGILSKTSLVTKFASSPPQSNITTDTCPHVIISVFVIIFGFQKSAIHQKKMSFHSEFSLSTQDMNFTYTEETISLHSFDLHLLCLINP